MFAVICIPDFSLQAVLRQEPELISRPVALTDPELAKLGIVQLTAGARVAGVSEGMSASQAMARCAEVVMKSRSRLQEESATEVLLQTAYAFSPLIEATALGVCTVELRGLRVSADESAARKWADEICKALLQFHLRASIGFAPTPELALLAAKTAPIQIVLNVAEFISSLPIEILGLPAELLGILRSWGIGDTGALLRLGKGQLGERLGPAAIEIFDRLSPHSIRPLKIANLPETFAEQTDFENEIETLEPLLFVLQRFTEQLSRRISALYLVVAELHLKLGLTSGAEYESVFKVPSPTANTGILFRMLHTHLENVRTDAPISSLCLAAMPGQPEAHQFGLFETTLRNPNQFAETLARLEALCGPDRVGTPILEPTLRPDSFRMKPPQFCGSKTGRKARRTSASVAAPRESAADVLAKNCGALTRRRYSVLQPAQCSTCNLQPATCNPFSSGLRLRRFRPPLEAQVRFREKRPVLIRSAVCNGAIADQRGPFFSSGNWWEDGRWWREEWDIQMADGTMCRIFRTERSGRGNEAELEQCFIEGVYD